MIKKMALMASLAAVALAGGSWAANDKLYPASKPIHADKYKEIELRCYGQGQVGLFNERKTRLIITQEHPCLSFDDFEYKKISDNKVEIYDNIAINGYDMVEDETDDGTYVLGKPGCKLKGKEHWIVYQVVNGHWQKVCETTFNFK